MADQSGEFPASKRDDHPEQSFEERVLHYLDSTLPDADVSVLNRELAADPRKRDKFVRLCLVNSLVQEEFASHRGAGGELESVPADDDNWLESIEPERIVSPPVEPYVAPSRGWTDVADVLGRIGWTRLAMAASVLLVVAVGLLFFAMRSPTRESVAVVPQPRIVVPPVPEVVAPPPVVVPTPVVVAKMTGQLAATWSSGALMTGEVLTESTSLKLDAGSAEITFVGGARTLIEGPAEFTVDTATAVTLATGRLSAMAAGGGFVVHTRTAVVTDLGTEFGVVADATGRTRVDVFQGEVKVGMPTVTATTNPSADPAPTLVAGQAAVVSTRGVAMDPAGAVPQNYARTLLSRATVLDVVDLVCGGDGTTRKRGMSLDVRTGEVGTLPQVAFHESDGKYHPVPSRPVVDGCFIPKATLGPVQVDSAGHTYTFPHADGTSYYLLGAGESIAPIGREARLSATMAGVDYSRPDRGFLFIHSNKGVTLDLAALRRIHPGKTPSRFRSLVGNNCPPDKAALANIYVLVDGKLRFERQGLTNKDAPFAVDVTLGEQDRFLTLVSTDKGNSIARDWILWADPFIDLR